ncbi:hypothetical protein LOK49_LG08G01621 [Camellia lanceoleosa]|uniref:Uncharacterized protein n=1 Tax=Camellia lanceoleosa TaxID=1840588 RepID=A0ACC0GYL4_9ERIC|nr:hypothetical protein LOK49_LG08G01621 [Camellia lanceoleosa]
MGFSYFSTHQGMGRAHFFLFFDTARVFSLSLTPTPTPDQSSNIRCIENTVDVEGCKQWMSSRFSVSASKVAGDQSSPTISLALSTVLQRESEHIGVVKHWCRQILTGLMHRLVLMKCCYCWSVATVVGLHFFSFLLLLVELVCCKYRCQ